MGLDACVYCDCVEKGRLRTPPPRADLIYIEGDGSPELRTDDLELSIAFDVWRSGNPCSHEQLCLLHHRLGNMSGIDRIRRIVRQIANQQIAKEPETASPLLWTRVIYSGIHAGDFLTPQEAISLGGELVQLKAYDLRQLTPEDQGFVETFLARMDELVKASGSVGKPISF